MGAYRHLQPKQCAGIRVGNPLPLNGRIGGAEIDKHRRKADEREHHGYEAVVQRVEQARQQDRRPHLHKMFTPRAATNAIPLCSGMTTKSRMRRVLIEILLGSGTQFELLFS